MRLRDDELLGLRVESTTGAYVGRVAGFVMDTESGIITQFRVRPKGIVAACFPGLHELLVGREQIISIDAKRMVVRDGTGSASARGGRKRMVPGMRPQPLTSHREP